MIQFLLDNLHVVGVLGGFVAGCIFSFGWLLAMPKKPKKRWRATLRNSDRELLGYLTAEMIEGE